MKALKKPKAKPFDQECRRNISVSPSNKSIYASRTAEAKAYLKAKIHLSNSRNLRTDIKAAATNAVEHLYQVVKEAKAVKRYSTK